VPLFQASASKDQLAAMYGMPLVHLSRLAIW